MVDQDDSRSGRHLGVERCGTRADHHARPRGPQNALTTAMVATITRKSTTPCSTTESASSCCGRPATTSAPGSTSPNRTAASDKPRTGHLQRRMMQGAHRMIRTLHEAQLPVVAGVSGWAAGVGNALALCADVVIADESARFWVPFVGKGFTPDSANSYLLPRLIGSGPGQGDDHARQADLRRHCAGLGSYQRGRAGRRPRRRCRRRRRRAWSRSHPVGRAGRRR